MTQRQYWLRFKSSSLTGAVAGGNHPLSFPRNWLVQRAQGQVRPQSEPSAGCQLLLLLHRLLQLMRLKGPLQQQLLLLRPPLPLCCLRLRTLHALSRSRGGR